MMDRQRKIDFKLAQNFVFKKRIMVWGINFLQTFFNIKSLGSDMRNRDIRLRFNLRMCACVCAYVCVLFLFFIYYSSAVSISDISQNTLN